MVEEPEKKKTCRCKSKRRKETQLKNLNSDIESNPLNERKEEKRSVWEDQFFEKGFTEKKKILELTNDNDKLRNENVKQKNLYDTRAKSLWKEIVMLRTVLQTQNIPPISSILKDVFWNSDDVYEGRETQTRLLENTTRTEYETTLLTLQQRYMEMKQQLMTAEKERDMLSGENLLLHTEISRLNNKPSPLPIVESFPDGSSPRQDDQAFYQEKMEKVKAENEDFKNTIIALKRHNQFLMSLNKHDTDEELKDELSSGVEEEDRGDEGEKKNEDLKAVSKEERKKEERKETHSPSFQPLERELISLYRESNDLESSHAQVNADVLSLLRDASEHMKELVSEELAPFCAQYLVDLLEKEVLLGRPIQGREEGKEEGEDEGYSSELVSEMLDKHLLELRELGKENREKDYALLSSLNEKKNIHAQLIAEKKRLLKWKAQNKTEESVENFFSRRKGLSSGERLGGEGGEVLEQVGIQLAQVEKELQIIGMKRRLLVEEDLMQRNLWIAQEANTEILSGYFVRFIPSRKRLAVSKGLSSKLDIRRERHQILTRLSYFFSNIRPIAVSRPVAVQTDEIETEETSLGLLSRRVRRGNHQYTPSAEESLQTASVLQGMDSDADSETVNQFFNATVRIQKSYRGYRVRREVRRVLHQMNETANDASITLYLANGRTPLFPLLSKIDGKKIIQDIIKKESSTSTHQILDSFFTFYESNLPAPSPPISPSFPSPPLSSTLHTLSPPLPSEPAASAIGSLSSTMRGVRVEESLAAREVDGERGEGGERGEEERREVNSPNEGRNESSTHIRSRMASRKGEEREKRMIAFSPVPVATSPPVSAVSEGPWIGDGVEFGIEGRDMSHYQSMSRLASQETGEKSKSPRGEIANDANEWSEPSNFVRTIASLAGFTKAMLETQSETQLRGREREREKTVLTFPAGEDRKRMETWISELRTTVSNLNLMFLNLSAVVFDVLRSFMGDSNIANPFALVRLFNNMVRTSDFDGCMNEIGWRQRKVRSAFRDALTLLLQTHFLTGPLQNVRANTRREVAVSLSSFYILMQNVEQQFHSAHLLLGSLTLEQRVESRKKESRNLFDMEEAVETTERRGEERRGEERRGEERREGREKPFLLIRNSRQLEWMDETGGNENFGRPRTSRDKKGEREEIERSFSDADKKGKRTIPKIFLPRTKSLYHPFSSRQRNKKKMRHFSPLLSSYPISLPSPLVSSPLSPSPPLDRPPSPPSLSNKKSNFWIHNFVSPMKN